MENAKRKRGRPPKRKAMEFEGLTYEGAINNALDKEVATELDDNLANKSEDELSDDERKYLKRKREKKSYTLNVRFTESEMQDIFTVIDTLITKMKHRDELEPVYKEYQGKSGWSQSRFKKKNAATIEDYEQTVKYIREHIKKYAVDGKPPTMLDLLEKSNKLKSKWNRLNVEHTAFLTKRETAKKYVRQVRNYINEEHNRRESEKYRQKKLTQQRKKDTLE